MAQTLEMNDSNVESAHPKDLTSHIWIFKCCCLIKHGKGAKNANILRIYIWLEKAERGTKDDKSAQPNSPTEL